MSVIHSANAMWTPTIPATTSYAVNVMRHPIVDERKFTRGNDALYCYDLRDLNSSATNHFRIQPSVAKTHLSRNQQGKMYRYDIRGRLLSGSSIEKSKKWGTSLMLELYQTQKGEAIKKVLPINQR